VRQVSLLFEELGRLAGMALFPGFSPLDVDLLLYDGENTFAIGQNPPKDFRPIPNQPRLAMSTGRHPTVVANSLARLNDRTYATLLLDPSKQLSDHELAALAIHETFHAYQARHFPQWAANEAALFTYPFTVADNETSKILELTALKKALATQANSSPWLRTHLDLRYDRYQKLDTEARTYEREIERLEGLARYVERKPYPKRIPDTLTLKVHEVRRRSYLVGEYLALLLDRVNPNWKQDLHETPEKYLDEIAAETKLPAGAQFTDQEFRAAQKRARTEIEGELREQKRQLSTFLSEPGWRLSLHTATPLYPRGFDPMNVLRLDDGFTLHMRYLALANHQIDLELLDTPALTKPTGSHPLFNGVAAVVITGLKEKPGIARQEDETLIESNGIKLRTTNDAAKLELDYV
jgi:hypothetical protein